MLDGGKIEYRNPIEMFEIDSLDSLKFIQTTVTFQTVCNLTGRHL